MSWTLLLVVIVWLIEFEGMVGLQQTKSTSRLNVVLIMFDDMRPIIGGYGDQRANTPHLDKFMNESFHFTRAYSQQALCAPSRNSMLTSRRPDTLRLYDFYNYWRTFVANFTTLPQYFKQHGYHTHSVGKIFHPGVSSNYSDDYPYSWSSRPFRPRSEKFMNSPVCPDTMQGDGVLHKNLICPVELKTQPLRTLPDIESVSEAIRFVRARQQLRKPYFLALGLHKPHINLRFPQHFLSRFDLIDFFNYTDDSQKPLSMPDVAWNPYTDVRARDDFKHMNISFPFGPIGREQSARIRQAYYAAVSYVDDLFGKFIAELKSNRTIVLVTSDHGWSLGEHAEWAKYSNFEVALRVPLIIRTPEFPIKTAKSVSSIVELLDVFPTLVDLAHLPQLPPCTQNISISQQITCGEGKSLYPLMHTKSNKTLKEEEYVAVSQYPRPGLQPTKHPNSDKPKLKNIKVMGYSMRNDHFRYTMWVRFIPSNFSRDWTNVYAEEMYDHRLDPAEDLNLAYLPEFDRERRLLRERLMDVVNK